MVNRYLLLYEGPGEYMPVPVWGEVVWVLSPYTPTCGVYVPNFENAHLFSKPIRTEAIELWEDFDGQPISTQ